MNSERMVEILIDNGFKVIKKPVYKIFNNNTKKYVTGYNSKKQWDSERWALNAVANDHKAELRDNVLELHTMHLVLTASSNPKDIINKKEEDARIKRMNEAERVGQKLKYKGLIEDVMGGIAIDSVLKLFRLGILDEEIMTELKPLILEYKKY